MKKFSYKCGDDDLWIPIPENYRDCLTLVQSDYFRLTGMIIPRWKLFFKRGNIRFNLWLRLSAYRGWAYIPCRLLLGQQIRKTNLQIYPSTKIGYGLYLGHWSSIIINPTAIIGNNCNLSQFSTIGSNEGKAASIGNNVYIGPSVCIVEDVNIGSNSTIGAGAVVTKDVPENKTVAGVPAKVISENGHSDYISRRWLF